jgi:WD40 repeat protein
VPPPRPYGARRAYSSDGRWIATASRDGTARIWDAHTGAALRVLKGHQADVWTIAFSPDDRRVVTSSADGSAQVWDRESGEQVYSSFKHPASVIDALYSPDGRWIATDCLDKVARLWNAETGELVWEFPPHRGVVWSTDFSPDSTRLVTTSTAEDGTARVWNVLSPSEPPLVLQGNDIRRAAFSPDGQRIVTSCWRNTARIWNAETGTEIAPLIGHPRSRRRSTPRTDA